MRMPLLLLITVLSSIQAACTATNDLTSDREFPPPNADFPTYIAQVNNHIVSRRLRGRSVSDARQNLPFELPATAGVPYRGKFLLFHGLNDSAYVWTDMARLLSTKGFDVRAVLLAGHGSHPQAMLDISYSRWLRDARRHFALWNSDDTPIYVGGFSLGGVLATILALEHPEVAGLLLISPAYHSKLDHLLQWSWLYAIYKPWMFGGMIMEDNPIKYNSIPINSGTQYYLTTKYLKDNWRGRRLKMPVMMVMSNNDSVVDNAYTRDLFHTQFSNPQSRLLVYTTNPEFAARENEIVRGSRYLDRRILNQSHLSLMNAPANPLFGENAKVLVCNGNEYPVYMACMRASGHWFGAQHTPSPDGVPVARTTYNPDFSFTGELIEQVFFH